jgi:hypothetical protein
VAFVANSGALPERRHLAVGSHEAEPYLERFWQPEQNDQGAFRWSDGAGTIWFREYAGAASLLVSLRVTRPGATLQQPLDLTLRSDERSLGIVPVTSQWRTYHLLVAPNGLAWRTPNLDLLSPTFRAGADDLRRLGVVVSDMTVAPTGRQLGLPLLLRTLYLAALVVLTRLWLQVLVRAPYALALSGVVGLLVALLWRLDPVGVDQRLPSPWLIALAATAAAVLLVYVAERRWSTGPSALRGRASPSDVAFLLVLAPIIAAVALTALLSLQWRMLHDAPLLMYIAFMIDHFQAVPYRDIFDQNMPGALAIYLLVGRFFGYGDLGFRVADLLVLALLSLCTWAWCRTIAGRYAILAPALFALLYLNYGPGVSMQRDYVLLLPVAASLALAVSPLRQHWRLFLVGLLFGFAAAIKPHAAIGLPCVVLFLVAEQADAPSLARWRQVLALSGIAALGFALPIAASALYLVGSGAGSSFLDMVVNYLPLFARITGTHETIAGVARVRYLIDGYMAFGGHYVWIGVALVGAAVALRRGGLARPQRRQIVLMLALAFCYSLYPIAQGRFWDYHWLPFLYTLALLSALCAVPQLRQPRLAGQVLPWLLIVAALAWRVSLPGDLTYQAIGHPLPAIKGGRIDQITAFLEARVQPGETVQPLDWTGGALHGMLNAEVPITTPFIYSFQFSHHVSRQYIQGLRQRFIADLRATPPQFILDMGDYNTLITGADTSASFPELEAIMRDDYTVVFQGAGYRIYERK